MADATFGPMLAGQEVALRCQLLGLRDGDFADRGRIRLAEVHEGVLDVGEHHEGVGAYRLRHDLARAVLVDDRFEPLVVALVVLHDGDTAAARGDHDDARSQDLVDGASLDIDAGNGRRHAAPPALLGSGLDLFDDVFRMLGLQRSGFLGIEEVADGLGGRVTAELGVVGIDEHLVDDRDHVHVHAVCLEVLLHRVLQHVADLALRHRPR